jgi:hypothetical protein
LTCFQTIVQIPYWAKEVFPGGDGAPGKPGRVMIVIDR